MLDFFGLFELNSLYVILGLIVVILVMLVLQIVNARRISKMKKTYEAFMAGKDGKSLEAAVTEKFAEIEALKTSNKTHKVQIKKINEELKRVYQKTGIVKYDAFNEMGGKLSFALAMLDKENNGYVINAMHSREGCYTYIKEIIKGESYITLGEEEKEALDKAISSDGTAGV